MRYLEKVKHTGCITACIAVAAVGLAHAETAVIAWEQRIGVTDYREDGTYNYIKLVAPDAAGNTVYAGVGRGR